MGARSATARAAPTPPLAGTPVSSRAVGDSSQRKLPALWQHAADAGRLPRHWRRPALRRPARLSRRRHGGPLLALHAAAHRRGGRRHPGHQPRRAGRVRGRWPRWRPIPAALCARPRCPTRGPRRAAWRCARATPFAADERSLHVDLCEDGRLDVDLLRPAALAAARVRRARAGAGRAWPQPVLAPVAPARARSAGSARVGDATIDLDGAVGLRREELGRGRHAAGVVVGPGARLRPTPTCASPSPAGAPAWAASGPRRRRSWWPSATRCAASCAPCARCASPSTSAAGAWPAAGIEVEAHADGVAPHLLPVPVPHERRRLDDWAPQHLTGSLRLSVRRGGRTLYEGTSALAGLERGRGHLG